MNKSTTRITLQAKTIDKGIGKDGKHYSTIEFETEFVDAHRLFKAIHDLDVNDRTKRLLEMEFDATLHDVMMAESLRSIIVKDPEEQLGNPARPA